LADTSSSVRFSGPTAPDASRTLDHLRLRHAGHGDMTGEGHHQAVIVGGAAGAAFNSARPGQRHVDIERAGSVVSLSRYRALCHWCAGSDANVINVFFVLVPGRVEVKSGRIRDIAPSTVRNNCDVIADLALVRVAFERIERIAHLDVRRPGNAAVGTPGIE